MRRGERHPGRKRLSGGDRPGEDPLKLLDDVEADLGMACFSSPFDATAVDFLVDELDVQVLKLASFEIDDLPLLRKMASTGRPLIASTGLASLADIDQAVVDYERDHGRRPTNEEIRKRGLELLR